MDALCARFIESICRTMNNIDESWKEFIEDGETTLYANPCQRLILMPVNFVMRTKQKYRIGKKSVLGKILYGFLEIWLNIVSVVSPYASDMHWFRVEAAWFVKGHKYERDHWLSHSYTYYRKDRLNFKEIEMLKAKLKNSKKHKLHNK